MLPTSSEFSLARRVCYRIAGIELNPITSIHDISLTLWVDGKIFKPLQRIAKGKVLRWEDVIINGTSDSKILLEILGYQRWPKVLRLKTKETLLSDIQKSIRLTIGFSGSIWTVTIQLLTEEESKRSREKILESLKQLDNSSVSLKSAGNMRKILSDFAFIAAKAHPSAELVILGLVDVLERLTEQDQWDEDIRALFSNMVGMIEIVQKAEGIPKMNTLERVVEDMMALFEDTHKYISAHGSKETTAFKFRRASGTLDRVKTLSNRFDKLKIEFIVGLGLETHMRSSHDILSQLRPINPSGHDRSRMCQDGTREDVISEIMDRAQWLPIQRSLLWIRGQAGIGKSSIAASVCERLVSAQSLAACFFCKRDDDALRDPLQLINSIVHSLAQRCPEYGKIIATTIRNSVELCNSHMDQRYQGFIEKPLQGLRDLNISPLVIVIDALDECGTPNSRQKLLGHLQEMSRLVPWLGLIVTSRPTPEIQAFFQNTHHNAAYTTPVDLQSFDASPDIYKFIERNLGDIAKRDSWPDKSIEKLCQRADGIFIWAATATRYILNAIGPTQGRLRNALGNQKCPVSDSLDGLYTSILLSGMRDAGDDNKALVRQCMGAIFMTSTRQPLSISNLSTLLDDRIDFWSLKRVVNNLGSVLIIDEQRGGIVRFFHPSFADYIIDPLRSEDFYVDLDQQNYCFARACLRIIQKEARFNICKLETSYLPNNQVLELAERINANISGSLRYSCLYWINHVIGSHSEELHNLIQEIIMGPRLIFWIEVLSLIDRTDIALMDLPTLIQWLGLLPDKFKSNAVFVQDVHKLVSVFHDAIATSTPHLYISALALCPPKSVIIENLGHLFPRRVKFRKGGNQHWPRWSRSITHPAHVISLTIDPTGRVLATGSHDGTICLWNLMTGLLKGDALSGHSKSVTSLEFSPDGARLVSGSVDGSVRIWNIEANRPVEGFSLSHSSVVTSVAFFADGKRIISGSWDGTIQTSSAETGEPINTNTPIVTSPKKINCIAISPDGAQIAYSFESREARVRDLQSGEERSLIGHSGEVTSIAFSRDGVYIITGSVDMTVQLWGSKSGDLVGRPLIGHSSPITAIAFSPDGSKIVSSCNDSILRVFDVKRSQLIGSPLTGHSGAVNCIAFTPDGAQIISGSLDKTLRIWTINTESKIGIIPLSHFQVPAIVHSLIDACPRLVMSSPMTGHTGEISAVAFSPDGLCVISGSSDGTAWMWDAKTGNPIRRPFKHNRAVNGLVVSPDGKYIATRYGTRVCVWAVDEDSLITRPLVEIFAALVLLVLNYHASRLHANRFENSEMGGTEEHHAIYSCICAISLLAHAARALLLGSYIPHPEDVSCICFSPNGSQLFSAARNGEIRVHDSKTFKLIAPPLRGSGITIACTSRDGQIISGSSDGSVWVWNILNQESSRIAFTEYPSSGGATVIAFAPRTNVVAFGFTDNSIRLWRFDSELGTARPINGALIGHSDLVRSIAFSSNQRLVVSGSDDMTARIWDLQTGSPLGGPFIGHSGPVRSVAFSPDNFQIVSGSADGTIKVWIVDPSTSTRSRSSDLRLESMPYESLSSPSIRIAHSGWYSHDKQSLSLWLPDHYRKVYDPRALICIPASPSDTIQLDFSDFMHGENWASIATDNVRNNIS